MNIFDAHNIIGDFGGAIVKSNSGFISDKMYPHSKQETYDAFTLLIGHIVSFGTKTREEYDSIYINIGQVENIVPHYLYEQQRDAEAVLAKYKNSVFRVFNKEKIKLAQNLSSQLLLQCSSNWGQSVNKIQDFDYADLVNAIIALFDKGDSITYDELVGLVYSFTSQKEPTPLEKRVFRSYKDLARMANEDFDYANEPLGNELKALISKNRELIQYSYERFLAMKSK